MDNLDTISNDIACSEYIYTWVILYQVVYISYILSLLFYFPAQLAGGFTLSDLLGKPWSQEYATGN